MARLLILTVIIISRRQAGDRKVATSLGVTMARSPPAPAPGAPPRPLSPPQSPLLELRRRSRGEDLFDQVSEEENYDDHCDNHDDQVRRHSRGIPRTLTYCR